MHTIPSFDTRASNNGIYHPLVEKLVRDQKSLALISPEDELVSARSGPWGQNGSNYTTRFHYRGNQDEATVHLFGETVGPEDGTALGALGSLNLRPGQVLLFLFFPLYLTNIKNRPLTTLPPSKMSLR